jgi:DinB superfamily
VTITPDTKDWTWVLQRRCPECGFDATSVAREELGDRLRENVDAWPALLGDARVRMRPRPDVWSALEYGCHVRDVFVLYLRRLDSMLTEDDPTFDNWDQDATAVTDRYGEQHPDAVLDALLDAGARLAARFDGVTGAAWQRTGTRSDGATFDVDSFGRYLLHDPVHHVWDVRQGYDALGA